MPLSKKWNVVLEGLKDSLRPVHKSAKGENVSTAGDVLEGL